MPIFRVHVGFELPFWLALQEREYIVGWRSCPHVLSVNNSVDRVEVGDSYLVEERLMWWCNRPDGEKVRAQLQGLNPGMPITRHAMKTVVTHVREVEADAPEDLPELYKRRQAGWIEETLQVVNRLIDAYMLAAHRDEVRGEAGRIASWDIGSVIVSFWDQSGSQQLGGHVEPVRTQTAPPRPFDKLSQQAFELRITQEDEYPLPLLLSISAWSHIQRGNYRAAIVDDFNAIELAVGDLVRDLAEERDLPPHEIEQLLRIRFDDVCRNLLPIVGGPRLTQWNKWSRVKEAQDIRNKVVHRGAHATRADANTVHDAAISTLKKLKGWQAPPPRPSRPYLVKRDNDRPDY